MIAAGWDTARNVTLGIVALWALTLGGFGALGLLYERRRRHRHQASMIERRTAAFETLRADNDLRARLDADVAGMIERIPDLDDDEIERWATELDAADPAVILAEARRNRPYDHEIDG